MKCWKCGMELEEDSMFCDNCGAKVTAEGREEFNETVVVNAFPDEAGKDPGAEIAGEASRPGGQEAPAQERQAAPVQTADPTQKEPSAETRSQAAQESSGTSQTAAEGQGPWVYCPNCGARFAEGEAFCDECGTSLLEDKPVGAAVQEGKEKKPFNKALLAIPAVVLVVGAGVLGMRLMGGGSSGDKVPAKLAYFQEESLMLIDLKKKKAEPVEITDSYMRSGGYYEGEDILSPDGTYLFYKENYDGDNYKLFRAKVSKPEAGEEIDTRVTSHKVLKDNTVLYVKKNKLYWFNGKTSLDFGKNVGFYKADEDAKHVVWSEHDDNAGSTYYYQDLSQKTDKVQLEKNVIEIRMSKDMTKFYVIKENNKMYQVDNKGNSESIDKDIAEIKSFNSETGEMYFIKYEPREVKYSEVVYDDTNMMSAGERERLGNEIFEIPSNELYYCGGWGKEAQMISENYGGRFASNGTYCLYSEYPSANEMKVKWSDMDSHGWSYAVQTALDENSLLKLAVGATAVAEYDDINYRGSRYNKDSETLYIYSEDDENEEGVIYVTSLKGKGAGELAEYDDDAYDVSLLFASAQGLYYLKDYENNSGDLYFNGDRIKSDVSWAANADKENLIACASDYYEGTYELSLYNGKKDIPVAKDVSAAECASDGTVVLMADYDDDLGEGDLMYFDGKELRELDKEVTNFAIRRGSTLVR